MLTPPDDMHSPLDSAVHRALLTSMIERGRMPTGPELASVVESTEEQVAEALRRLEAQHGVVLHPGTVEPWLVHPFSSTPTLFFVRSARRGWWAPCIWCALGVAVLIDEPVRIATVLGGETRPIALRYEDEAVHPAGLFAHFPVPVAQAWDNVHRHCACTLVFDSTDSIATWCEEHGITRGEVLPLAKVAELARVWYGGHLDPDWTKPTASEARARFETVGLTSDHWYVPASDEPF